MEMKLPLLFLLLLLLLSGLMPPSAAPPLTPEELEQRALRNLEEASDLASDISSMDDCDSLEECEDLLEEIGDLAWDLEILLSRAISDLESAYKLRQQTSSSSP